MIQEPMAWVEEGDFLYWSRSSHSVFESSVIRLITGIYQRDPRWARRIVRNRIFTTEALTESSWGTVKVAARRVDFSVRALKSGASHSVEIVPSRGSADQPLNDTVEKVLLGWRGGSEDDVWKILDRMIAVAQSWESRILALPVAAVLVDSEERILSWGVNSAWDYRTEHAETNLIRRWYAKGCPGVPEKLWVTRKSCKMCSGWIWDAFAGPAGVPTVQVCYRDPDEGPLAKTTVLDVGSFENRRALASARSQGLL